MHKLPQTVDEVIAVLDDIIDDNVLHKNYNAVFAYVYRRTTIEIKTAIERGDFEDAEEMEKFDVYFANLYIKAYYDYREASPLSISWATTIKAGEEKLTLIQHVLLGMNAHINFDLGKTAAHMAKGKEIDTLQNDFRKINEILVSLTNEIQSKLSSVSPLLFLLDLIGGNRDEKIANFSIKIAREQSWNFAKNLWTKEEIEQGLLIEEVDNRVSKLAKKLINPSTIILNTILKIIKVFEQKSIEQTILALRK